MPVYQTVKAIQMEKCAEGITDLTFKLTQEFLKPTVGMMGSKSKMALQRAHFEMMAPKYKETYQRTVNQDSILKDYENKEALAEAYKVMIKFAPHLAAEPLIAKGFLRMFAHGDGIIPEQQLKSLMDAEGKYKEQ